MINDNKELINNKFSKIFPLNTVLPKPISVAVVLWNIPKYIFKIKKFL